MSKAIGYIRVSTAGQVDDGVSLDAQEARIRAWAAANDADDILIFRDEGISGGRADNRPGLQSALDAVSKGDQLVVYSLSRLSRSTCDLLAIAEDLRDRGADLTSLSEKIDTSGAAGKMIFRVLAVLCEFESDQISDRTRAALSFKRSRGEKTGGDRPFGYNVNDGKLVPNAEEQRVIRAMARRRARGASFRAIGQAFGGRHPQVIKRILERTRAGMVTA